MASTLSLAQTIACVVGAAIAGGFLAWAAFISRFRFVERACRDDGRLPIITE